MKPRVHGFASWLEILTDKIQALAKSTKKWAGVGVNIIKLRRESFQPETDVPGRSKMPITKKKNEDLCALEKRMSTNKCC